MFHGRPLGMAGSGVFGRDWAGALWRVCGGRGHDLGRVHPRYQARGRRGNRRHPKHQRFLPLFGDQGRQGHGSRSDHKDGRGSPGLQGALAAPGRQDQRQLRAHRYLVGAHNFWRLAPLRPRAGVNPGAAQPGGRTDHRLPVCHGSRHPDLDHGRHRQGRRSRHPHQGRRSPRESAFTEHGRPGQDRNPHQGHSRTDRRHHRWRPGRGQGRCAGG